MSDLEIRDGIGWVPEGHPGRWKSATDADYVAEVERLRARLAEYEKGREWTKTTIAERDAEIERLRAERDQAPGLPWLLEKTLRAKIERLRAENVQLDEHRRAISADNDRLLADKAELLAALRGVDDQLERGYASDHTTGQVLRRKIRAALTKAESK